MKPTFPITDLDSEHSFFAGRRRSRSLRTDCHFQAGRIDHFSGRCNGDAHPSFRGISEAYFRHEARRNFRSEAAFFALIAMTVAVPMAESIYALATLVYSGL